MRKKKKHMFYVTLCFGASTTCIKDACNTFEQKEERKEKSSMFHSVLSQHCRYQSCNRSKKLILLDTSNNSRTATGRKRGSYSHVAHQLWETPPPLPLHTPLDASNNSRTRLQQEGKEGLILVFQSAVGEKNIPL